MAELASVCAVCRREFPNRTKAEAHYRAEHPAGTAVDIHLDNGGRIQGTTTAEPVIELHQKGKAPKVKGRR